MKLGIAGVLLFIAAYVATNFVYAGAGHGPHDLTQGRPMTDGTTITMDLQEVQQSNTVLLANLAIVPGPTLLDPRTHDLTQDFSVVVTSAASPTKRSWSKGMVPGSFPVPLSISGAVTDWPFDHYVSGPVTVEVFRGDNPVPERAAVTFADRLAGWRRGDASSYPLRYCYFSRFGEDCHGKQQATAASAWRVHVEDAWLAAPAARTHLRSVGRSDRRRRRSATWATAMPSWLVVVIRAASATARWT